MPQPRKQTTSKPATKQPWQLRAAFALAKRVGIDKDQLEAIAGDLSHGRTFRLSQLSYTEANQLIVRLGGDPDQRHSAPAKRRRRAPRTERHLRQRAGVKQIVQQRHVDLLNELAAERWGVAYAAPLRSLAERMRIPYPCRTTDETNKLIEAIKAMNARDRKREVAA